MIPRFHRSILLAAALVACLVHLGTAQRSESRVPTDPAAIRSLTNGQAMPAPVESLFQSRRIVTPAWQPGGTDIVLTTNLTGRFNLWKVDSRGGWPIQLTDSSDRQDQAVWSPDGRWIVYRQDRQGNERYDLFVIPAGGGSPSNVTITPDVVESGARFSPDGRWLAFETRHVAEPSINIALLDWQMRTTRLLTNETRASLSWSIIGWTADGRYLFANRLDTNETNAEVHRIDVGTGVAALLTPHSGNIRYVGSSITSDGRSVLLSSNESGSSNVGVLDTATKQIRWITRTSWEAIPGFFSPDNRYLTYRLNEDGQSTLFVYDTRNRETERVPFMGGSTGTPGRWFSFSADSTQLLVSYQDGRRPVDAWIYDLKSKALRQLTRSAVASLEPEAMAASRLVHFKSFDGTVISAYLWMPYNLKRDGSNPAVVLPHGGPSDQTLDVFDERGAALASRGYICLAPNFRGSSGYGPVFLKANHKDLGGGDLQDLVYAARFLVDTGYVDPRRIGMTGTSYGGFLTFMALGKTPEVWAAGVAQAGIWDWSSLFERSDGRLREYQRSLMGNPIDDREVYLKSSPLTYAMSIRSPLLVLHGENDPRVPKEQAEAAVQKLRAGSAVVDIRLYAGEGHGILRRENQIDALNRTIEFFDRHLRR